MNDATMQTDTREFLKGRVLHNQSMVVGALMESGYWDDNELLEALHPNFDYMTLDDLCKYMEDLGVNWWDIVEPGEVVPVQEYAFWDLDEDGTVDAEDQEEHSKILDRIFSEDPLDIIRGEVANYLHDNYEAPEIFEWYLVDDLSHKLKEHGEVVLSDGLNSWWGRTTTGQAVYMDHVMQQIAREYQ